jgi:hypothetical protein
MKTTRIALYVALFTTLAFAQQPLTNEAVLKLAKADMGDDVIVNMIGTQPATFALSTDDLIALKAGGVSQKVISAMLLKNSGAAPSPAVTTVAVPPATPVSEIGVYYRKAGTWEDMDPEIVNFKSGGVLKSLATDGLIKGDMNSNIKGAQSKTLLAPPVEILIYAPDGVAATEYQLLLLHVSGDSREFRTVTGGVFHKSGGASRDAVEFAAKKIAPRTYSLILSNLKPGEYGILPPSSGDATGSTGRLGKLYTFRVAEDGR